MVWFNYNEERMNRIETKKIKIGNVTLGGSNKILIQSMCDIKTSNYKKVIKQINECARLGASMMRVSIQDNDDVSAITKIKEKVSIPVICDIHYSLDFALKAIGAGADAIRINPGNINNNDKLNVLLKIAHRDRIPIRIGVNEGSLKISKEEKKDNEKIAKALVDKTLEYVKYFEEHNFDNIVLSVKSSSPDVTLIAYRMIAKKTNYPIHIGVTESGFDEVGIIRSISVLSPLILEGIGSTIRISLTKDPYKEIITAKRLLHDLGLYSNYPTLISCPTCGRTMVKNIKVYCEKTLKYLEENNINIKVAIMGCPVNGINEAKDADLGLAGAGHDFIIFKKGKEIAKVKEKDALKVLFAEIDTFKKVK